MHEAKDRQIRVKRAHLLYTDVTSAKVMELPDQASILLIGCSNAATAVGATLDVGTLANDDYFVAALDVAAATMHYAALLQGGAPMDGPVDVYMHLDGAPAAGGPLEVWVLYTSEFYTFR